MGSEWQPLSWRPSPGPWLPPPLGVAERSRDPRSSSAAGASPLASRAPCPPSPTLGRPRGSGTGRAPANTHQRCRRLSQARPVQPVRPGFSHPVGPPRLFSLQLEAPRGTGGPFPEHSKQWHSEWGQFPGTEGRAAEPWAPQTRPPGVRSGRGPIPDPEGSKEEEMHSLVSQSLPAGRKDVKRMKYELDTTHWAEPLTHELIYTSR